MYLPSSQPVHDPARPRRWARRPLVRAVPTETAGQPAAALALPAHPAPAGVASRKWRSPRTVISFLLVADVLAASCALTLVSRMADGGELGGAVFGLITA